MIYLFIIINTGNIILPHLVNQHKTVTASHGLFPLSMSFPCICVVSIAAIQYMYVVSSCLDLTLKITVFLYYTL